jgi:DNA-binding NarL/FixJ family response regulator
MERLKYILIDDNESFRGALKTILVSQFNAEIIGEARNAEEAKKLVNLVSADIILMDVMMPGENGIQLTKELLWTVSSTLKIIAITMHVDKVYLTTLVEAGFRGCIFKNDLISELEDAIKTVRAGSLYFPQDILLSYNQKITL